MLRPCLLVISLLLFSTTAAADQINTGSVSLFLSNGSFVVTVFDVGGANFSASGSGRNIEPFGMAPCLHVYYVGNNVDGCKPGNVVQLSARSGQWTTGDMSGSLWINGQPYSFGFLSTGEMVFTGGSVVIPVTQDPNITLTAPFTMTGFLHAIDGPGSAGVSLFGSGIVSIRLNRWDFDSSGNPVYRLETIGYSFQPRTPEPGTILLLGTGLAGVVSIALKRRRSP